MEARSVPRPFFASDDELKSWDDSGGDEQSYFVPTLEITQERFVAATYEIEKLADWIEGRMDKAWQWRHNART
jgi:hypothetical protein